MIILSSISSISVLIALNYPVILFSVAAISAASLESCEPIKGNLIVALDVNLKHLPWTKSIDELESVFNNVGLVTFDAGVSSPLAEQLQNALPILKRKRVLFQRKLQSSNGGKTTVVVITDEKGFNINPKCERACDAEDEVDDCTSATAAECPDEELISSLRARWAAGLPDGGLPFFLLFQPTKSHPRLFTVIQKLNRNIGFLSEDDPNMLPKSITALLCKEEAPQHPNGAASTDTAPAKDSEDKILVYAILWTASMFVVLTGLGFALTNCMRPQPAQPAPTPPPARTAGGKMEGERKV